MQETLSIPSYLDQEPAVRERFAKLKSRPVILDVQNLTKRFVNPQGETVTALNDISFQVHQREFTCIIGPSGCGKSTLIRLLAGLDDPSAGKVMLDGQPVEGPGPDRGMVFQSYTLFPWLTVKRNVMFGLQMTGSSSIDAEQEARSWVDLVGLGKFENAYPHQLSGGMKQRVAIARVLANKPRILLMDEPFAALDAQTRAEMQSYLLQIWHNVDVTILFITHDLDEASYLSDRILVLGANPSCVKEVIEVPVPRPRNTNQFLSPSFIATKQRLEELIHPRKNEEDYRLPIFKLTQAGDEVE